MLPSQTDLLLLHGLRLKGTARPADLADFVGLDGTETDRQLGVSAEAGWVRFRDGDRPVWSLTAEGRKEHERLLADELDRAERRGDVSGAYRRFRDLNPLLLGTCTAWQIKDVDGQKLNDHLDPDYDAAVVADLGEIHVRVRPICDELASWFSRFAEYGPRFDAAMDRLRAGEPDWFTKPTIDSYHTVWFELHEDLLATLGIDRASERDSERTRERD